MRDPLQSCVYACILVSNIHSMPPKAKNPRAEAAKQPFSPKLLDDSSNDDCIADALGEPSKTLPQWSTTTENRLGSSRVNAWRACTPPPHKKRILFKQSRIERKENERLERRYLKTINEARASREEREQAQCYQNSAGGVGNARAGGARAGPARAGGAVANPARAGLGDSTESASGVRRSSGRRSPAFSWRRAPRERVGWGGATFYGAHNCKLVPSLSPSYCMDNLARCVLPASCMWLWCANPVCEWKARSIADIQLHNLLLCRLPRYIDTERQLKWSWRSKISNCACHGWRLWPVASRSCIHVVAVMLLGLIFRTASSPVSAVASFTRICYNSWLIRFRCWYCRAFAKWPRTPTNQHIDNHIA